MPTKASEDSRPSVHVSAEREARSASLNTLSTERHSESGESALSARQGLDRLLLVLALGIISVTLLLSPGSLSERLDRLGRAVCGQLPEHSFFFGGRQFPLCARCTGTYLGALTTYVMLSLMGRGRATRLPPFRILVPLVAFIFFWALDGLNSYLTLFSPVSLLYEPSNLLRLIAGLLQGLALIVIVRPIFAFTLWAETRDEYVLRSYGELALLLAAVAVVGVLAWSELSWLFYPLALSGGAGVLLVLGLVNTLIVCILLRRERAATNWRQAALLWLLGLAAALIEVKLINAAREALSRVLGLPL